MLFESKKGSLKINNEVILQKIFPWITLIVSLLKQLFFLDFDLLDLWRHSMFNQYFSIASYFCLIMENLGKMWKTIFNFNHWSTNHFSCLFVLEPFSEAILKIYAKWNHESKSMCNSLYASVEKRWELSSSSLLSINCRLVWSRVSLPQCLLLETYGRTYFDGFIPTIEGGSARWPLRTLILLLSSAITFSTVLKRFRSFWWWVRHCSLVRKFLKKIDIFLKKPFGLLL